PWPPPRAPRSVGAWRPAGPAGPAAGGRPAATAARRARASSHRASWTRMVRQALQCSLQENGMSNLQTIVLGGGCFWCTEAVYKEVRGVTDVESGYSNGETQQPTYEQVCTGRTGHNEVVKLTYDP